MYDRFTKALVASLAYDPEFVESFTNADLEIDTHYKILIATGLDVTNVGAADNVVGTEFWATGTTPTSWGTGYLQMGLSPSDITTNNLAFAVTHLTNFASQVGASYSETAIIKEATMLYALFLLYSNNQKAEGGSDEFALCVNLLCTEWGNGIRDVMIPEDAQNTPLMDIPKSAEAYVSKIDWEEFDEEENQ